MSKLDELKALMAAATPGDVSVSVFARALYETAPALIAAVEALDPFSRVAKIMDSLNLPDDKPLRDCAPGLWPTLGDCRKARAALAPFGE